MWQTVVPPHHRHRHPPLPVCVDCCDGCCCYSSSFPCCWLQSSPRIADPGGLAKSWVSFGPIRHWQSRALGQQDAFRGDLLRPTVGTVGGACPIEFDKYRPTRDRKLWMLGRHSRPNCCCDRRHCCWCLPTRMLWPK